MARKKKAASARPAKPVGEHLKLVDEILRDNAVLQRHMQHSTIDDYMQREVSPASCCWVTAATEQEWRVTW
jgi:hypothetical protein